jgi:hypothetical protein
LATAVPARQKYDAVSAVEWAGVIIFIGMVSRRLASLAPDRMNAKRAERLRPDNPGLPLLRDLVVGMKVHLPDIFTPNGKMPRSPRRPMYETVATAVNKMLGGIREQKLAFLSPLDMAQEHIPNLNLCKAHWTHKKGKKCGLPLGDLSNVDGIKINDDDTAAAAIEYYGRIHHTTTGDIAVIICNLWTDAKAKNPELRWEDMRIWKMDLKGAHSFYHSIRKMSVCSLCYLRATWYISRLLGFSGGRELYCTFSVVLVLWSG